MDDGEIIVGIDLGTTHSEIAAMIDGQPRVLGPTADKMLHSCVGISPTGELLVGESARNQLLVYPERTVRSVKRHMGADVTFQLGDRSFTPSEISALILRELAEWGARQFGRPIRKAVITVPAYFSDAQRQATREAGALAGLEVVRILNEPTAASLAYGFGDGSARTVMVYDLGGGTFDVSIVTMEGDVTEVLASHGNNRLGGDDFDERLLGHLLEEFRRRHGVDLRDQHPAAHSRLRWAAEEAKRKLSFGPYATVREEALITVDGTPLHLEVELARRDYEEMIRPLVESTLDSVTKALSDAGKRPDEIDAVLLAGGSTRTPLVREVLAERVGIEPRQDIHPDLCVALGAGLLASRLAGHDVRKVLVDVSPYSFGPSYLGEKDGRMYSYCYHPIIRRNTPLPVTRTDQYATVVPYQEIVELHIFQGDDPDALKNILVGEFLIEDLTPVAEPNEVLCQMSLDLDGILKVTAIEKRTGNSKHISIHGATQPKADAELAAAQERLKALYSRRVREMDETFADLGGHDDQTVPEVIDAEAADGPAGADAGPGPREPQPPVDAERGARLREARELIDRSRKLLAEVHDEDKEELIDLHTQMEEAIRHYDDESLRASVDELRELLFFIEGR